MSSDCIRLGRRSRLDPWLFHLPSVNWMVGVMHSDHGAGSARAKRLWQCRQSTLNLDSNDKGNCPVAGPFVLACLYFTYLDKHRPVFLRINP